MVEADGDKGRGNVFLAARSGLVEDDVAVLVFLIFKRMTVGPLFYEVGKSLPVRESSFFGIAYSF